MRRSSRHPRCRERRYRCAGRSRRSPGRGPIARFRSDEPGARLAVASCASRRAIVPVGSSARGRARRGHAGAARARVGRCPRARGTRRPAGARHDQRSRPLLHAAARGAAARQNLVAAAVPLGVFLLLLNGGYLAIFTTAGGQTIGKMLTGIKVVADHSPGDLEADAAGLRVTLGAAVLRATAYSSRCCPRGWGSPLFSSTRTDARCTIALPRRVS